MIPPATILDVPFAATSPLPPKTRFEKIFVGGDNLGDGYRCVAPHLTQRPGGRVVVFGGIGSVPLYAAMFARALGASTVDYIDPDPLRRTIAERVGATAMVELPVDRRAFYDIAVDATLYDPAGLTNAFSSIRTDGTVVGATIYLKPPTIPVSRHVSAQRAFLYRTRPRPLVCARRHRHGR